MATIPKNTKAAKSVFQRAKRATVHRLDTGFVGRDVDPKYAEKALYESRHPKLSKGVDRQGRTRYTVHVHGNLWYYIWT